MRLSKREYEKLVQDGSSSCGNVRYFCGLCATHGLRSATSATSRGRRTGAGTTGGSCYRSASRAPGRSACRCSRPGIRLDAGILGLAWPMGLGRRPLGTTAFSTCGLGSRPLGPSRTRLRLGQRTLALIGERLQFQF